ncbi:MAG TPA: hypothetical protein VFS00_17180, partial [Polyangiaceae bacterium]|nr:hypothetical protein [Polyangiaceae bacterium]
MPLSRYTPDTMTPRALPDGAAETAATGGRSGAGLSVSTPVFDGRPVTGEFWVVDTCDIGS